MKNYERKTRPYEDGPFRERDWGGPSDEELTICTEGFFLPYVQGFSSSKPKELDSFLLNDVVDDDVLLFADNHTVTAILWITLGLQHHLQNTSAQDTPYDTIPYGKPLSPAWKLLKV